MTRLKDHKLLIGLLAVVVIIGAVVVTTNFSKAMTADEARKIAVAYVPSTAEYIETEDHDSNFEVNFYDSVNKESFEVEVHKESKAIKKIETQLDDDRGSKVVKLTEKEAVNIIKNKFNNITSTKVTLNKDDGLYKYEVSFKAKDFYGSAEVNPETGKILESEVKYGSAITVPNDGTPTGSSGLLTIKEAEAAAIKHLGGGKVTGIDLDKEHNTYYYEVEVLKDSFEYELLVDAKTGEVTLYDKDKHSIYDDDFDDDSNVGSHHESNVNSNNNTNSNGNLIGEARAKQIVINKIGGGSIVYIKLDNDDGTKVYEGKAVKGKYEYEFEINAKSGVIIDWDKELQDKYENDDDDDDFDD